MRLHPLDQAVAVGEQVRRLLDVLRMERWHALPESDDLLGGRKRLQRSRGDGVVQ